MGILKILFFLLLLLFPLAEIARFEIVSGVNITFNDIGVCLLLVVWLLVFLKQKKISEITHTPYAKQIGYFILVCIVSLIVNSTILQPQEILIAFLYILRWTAYAGVYFIVVSFDNDYKKKIVWMLVGIGSILVTGGYAQYLLYPSLRNLYYLGWDEHLYRMFSGFLDPNFAGVFFVFYFILLLGLLLQKQKKWLTLLLVFLAIGTLIAVFLTYSRSALLTLFVSFTFLLFSQRNLIKKNFVSYLVGFIAVCVLLIIVVPKSFQTEGTNIFRSNSSFARVESAKNALAIIKDNLLFGVGFNAYRYAQIRYGFRSGEQLYISHADAGTDNSFLFIIATTGIVGGGIYFFLWFSLLKEKSNSFMHFVFLSCVLGIFVSALFINSLFYPFFMEWMWILLGLRKNI